MEEDVWERKYHLALARIESDERDFRRVEDTLRRLATRLAMLARGQGDESDRWLDRVGEQLRGAVVPENVDALLEALAGIVVALDTPRDASDPETVTALREDIARLQGLLAELGPRLQDMLRFLAGGLSDVDDGDQAGRVLDENVRSEMRAIGEQLAAATDLAGLRMQVSERLAMIDRHFSEHREREEARVTAYRDRARRMRHRVEELEVQATTLQDSLRREHELALTDPLTGLPNRLAWERRMADVEQGVRAGASACIAAFDIDHFKAINDTFGHAAGDAVLRIVARTLSREMGEGAFLARYGGEEFVVVYTDTAPPVALARAESLRVIIEALAFHASGRPVPVTMSGGVASFGAATEAATAVFERADRALYAAKHAGRNRCVVL
ncbi:GGDEF domain-containing protein [Luteibacter aegosomatis]|uniref:GGDEF domain-containing protein n=1 Tax=Luteibacter aegosomatis TaxID=2911537 RepID=UPI001FFB435F|nr:GGDEF domain-containing protein [Luteibacter aegosomatis]UPG85144.1 GGDEF domain-containing protein [Luteibacter aegosomatis]